MLEVIQTRVTSDFAGSPVALKATDVPTLTTSGFAFMSFIVPAGLPGSTSGPGSGAAPGMIGDVTTVGSAEAADPRTRTPMAAAIAVNPSRRRHETHVR